MMFRLLRLPGHEKCDDEDECKISFSCNSFFVHFLNPIPEYPHERFKL